MVAPSRFSDFNATRIFQIFTITPQKNLHSPNTSMRDYSITTVLLHVGHCIQ